MRMLVTVEFAEADAKTGNHRVLVVGRDGNAISHGDIGLNLADAKRLLESIQDQFVEAQAAQITEQARRCPLCSKRLGIKDWTLRRVHTLFVHVLLPRLRLISCRCDSGRPRAISPLKRCLSGSSNELRYQVARLVVHLAIGGPLPSCTI